jgi:hypothetical protein
MLLEMVGTHEVDAAFLIETIDGEGASQFGLGRW